MTTEKVYWGTPTEVKISIPSHTMFDVEAVHQVMNDHLLANPQSMEMTLLRLISIGVEEFERMRREDR
jgi:hypothetical protein